MPIIELPEGAAQISSERAPPESSTQWPAIQASWARVTGLDGAAGVCDAPPATVPIRASATTSRARFVIAVLLPPPARHPTAAGRRIVQWPRASGDRRP